jgi:hypothetical protein
VGEGVVCAEEGDIAILPVAELGVAIANELLFSERASQVSVRSAMRSWL